MKHFTCALLTASTILTASAPAVLAQTNDTGIVQTNVQTGIITGDDNAVLQQNRQMNKVRGRRGNNVSVQDNDQLCDLAGNANACTQRSRQENTVRNSRDRRSFSDDDD